MFICSFSPQLFLKVVLRVAVVVDYVLVVVVFADVSRYEWIVITLILRLWTELNLLPLERLSD